MVNSNSNQALNPRVLVADDTPDLLALLCSFVCREKLFRCAPAEDGDQAIALYEKAIAENDPFRMLILDAAMPGKTGFQVAEYVRGKGDNVPIILVTAYEDALNRAHQSYVGADDIFIKPFESDDLKHALTLAWAMPGQRRAAREAYANSKTQKEKALDG